jgi:hypothetical protein
VAASEIDVAVAAATAVGGVGAAVGAVAAWQAAKASSRTSRDALAALAVGIRPSIFADIVRKSPEGEAGERFAACVYATTSEFDALDVEVDVWLANGETLSESTSRIRAGGWFEFPVSDPLADGAKVHDTVGRIAVRYSDARRIARYEIRRRYLERTDEHGTTIYDWEESHEQVDGPRPSAP